MVSVRKIGYNGPKIDFLSPLLTDDLRREFDFGTLHPYVCLASLSNKQYPHDFISFHILHHVTFMRGSVKRIEKPELPGFQMRKSFEK